MPRLEEQNVTICIFKSLCSHQSFQQKSLDDHSCSAAVSIKRSETSLDVELLLQWRPFLQRDGQRPFSVFFADQLKVTVGHFDVAKINPIAYKDIQLFKLLQDRASRHSNLEPQINVSSQSLLDISATEPQCPMLLHSLASCYASLCFFLALLFTHYNERITFCLFDRVLSSFLLGYLLSRCDSSVGSFGYPRPSG